MLLLTCSCVGAERWTHSPVLSLAQHKTSAVLFGADQRIRVGDTTSAPFSFVTKIIIDFKDAYASCSGVMISPKHVLTAGHCVYSRYDGGFAISAMAVPGYQTGLAPFGAANVIDIQIPRAWRSGDPDSDIALLTLDASIGDLSGYVAIKALNAPIGKSISVVGYPGDLEQAEAQYADSGRVRAVLQSRLVYRLDTAVGESGAGLLFNSSSKLELTAVGIQDSSALDLNDLYVVGVHSGGSVIGNQGVRITRASLRVLRRLIK